MKQKLNLTTTDSKRKTKFPESSCHDHSARLSYEAFKFLYV
jgi:hypothetical protein